MFCLVFCKFSHIGESFELEKQNHLNDVKINKAQCHNDDDCVKYCKDHLGFPGCGCEISGMCRCCVPSPPNVQI